MATALAAGPVPRYAAVYEDVIIGVPAARRAPLIEALRGSAAIPLLPRRGLRGVVGRALRRAGLR